MLSRLVLLILSTAALWMALLQAQQRAAFRKEVKRTIKAALGEEECQRLAFHRQELEELQWEHSAEFKYRGAMYDVIRTEEKSDSIIYYCWWDAEESELNQRLERLHTALFPHLPKQKDHQLMLMNWLRGHCLESTTVPIHPSFSLKHSESCESAFLLTTYREVASPPPRSIDVIPA